jgi:CRISPR-associated protein Cmr2
MSWQKPGTDYWDNKLAAWWHDPIDKVFDIRGHEERAAQYLESLGLQRPNEAFWKAADGMAAGFERGQVPSYNADLLKNGAVDFAAAPILTHPTSAAGNNLTIDKTSLDAARIFAELKEFLKSNDGFEGYANSFSNQPDRYAIARFYYTHLVLRFMLAEKNIGGIGALWHRLPADSRFPDHSIWQHNALCSAFYSCMELAKKEDQIGLIVFSITPVQAFISKARKLRDYWTGSVLLSWLAFEGIKWVMENLGPDHILYPSLIDQPLVGEYLGRNWAVRGGLKPALWDKHPKNIASFPNKFLFLAPFDRCEDITEEIRTHIKDEWQKLSRKIASHIVTDMKSLSEDEAKYIYELFDRQTGCFWEFQWAATRLIGRDDKAEVMHLLGESRWKEQYALVDAFQKISKAKGYPDQAARGSLYSVTHSLSQSALAAEKTLRSIRRGEEPGEKCQMCGEFEVLHARKWGGEDASHYKKHLRDFWSQLNLVQKSDVDFKENERLCAICLTKRMAGKALVKENGHILSSVFKGAETFPSTTEMALHDYFKRNAIGKDKQKNIAQSLHESEDDRIQVDIKNKLENRDKYYAILLMDGDNMGKLINGETIASSWETIMHPDMVKRIQNPKFDSLYHDVWSEIWKKRRLITPAIHAAISEALGDFSIYGAVRIIKKYEGRLIYAGGDDVCAVLPMENAYVAANEIRKHYTSVFQEIETNGQPRPASSAWTPRPGKLSLGLGIGSGISISAVILICHHKESLTQMIACAHDVLKDKAKTEAGRNACAVELRKRNGGSRYFVRKWDSEGKEAWKSFMSLGGVKGNVSNRLIYRLEGLRPGIEAITKKEGRTSGMIERFILAQLERSETGGGKPVETARDIANVIIGDNGQFSPEGLIIASFIAGGENELV